MATEGRTIVISGGATGIGRAAAEMLRSRGANVAIVDWNGDAAEELAGGIGARSYRAEIGRAHV